MAAVGIGSLSCAALCFALALCIAVSQPSYGPDAGRREPTLDRPLLTTEQEGEGRATGVLVVKDSSGATEYAWDYFRERYQEYLWRE